MECLFLLFIGVLLRHTSCLFAWYLQKCLLREEIFYPFLFATLDLKRFLPFPTLFPLFLIRYSVCCTFNQHTGLLLQCTIKELFLCLTPLFSLLWFWGLAFCLLVADRTGGNGSFSLEGKKALWRPLWVWARMIGKTSWTGQATLEGQVHLIWICIGLSLLPRGFCQPWLSAEGRPGVLVGKKSVL